MTKPFTTIRCPQCWKKSIFPAKPPSTDKEYAWGKCTSCGWYGKLKSALKDN